MEPLYGGAQQRRITVADILRAKENGEHWPMLTSYDALTAGIFDQAGIPVLLVGDSAANVVLGLDTTLPITVDEMLVFTRAVVRGSSRAMVVADLPFGSYQESPQQALRTAVRFVKEGGAHAVKLEGGERVAEHIQLITEAGIPVVGHVGLTPQSIHQFSGYRVQGRGAALDQVVADAQAVAQAGAFMLVLEVVTAATADAVCQAVPIPVVGIGAGNHTDAQVLVWPDLVGLTEKAPKFVTPYADLRGNLATAVTSWAADVASGKFPEHSYE